MFVFHRLLVLNVVIKCCIIIFISKKLYSKMSNENKLMKTEINWITDFVTFFYSLHFIVFFLCLSLKLLTYCSSFLLPEDSKNIFVSYFKMKINIFKHVDPFNPPQTPTHPSIAHHADLFYFYYFPISI